MQNYLPLVKRVACVKVTQVVAIGDQNIGRSIAVRLAEQGANVVINGSSNQAACEATADLVRDAGLLPKVQQLSAEILHERADLAAAIMQRWIGEAGEYGNV